MIQIPEGTGRFEIKLILTGMNVGDVVAFHAETSEEIRRVHNRLSNFGRRNGKAFRGKSDWRTRSVVVERVE